MSVNNPNESERKQIVNIAIDDFLKKNPDWAGAPEDDLTRLFKKFEATVKQVHVLAQPTIEMEITSGTIHSAPGRKRFLLHTHKLFLDSFHTFNKEELLFLLAWTHANLLMQEHV